MRNNCLSADFADHIDYTENRDINAAKNNKVTTFTPFAKGGLGGISGEDLQNGNGKRGRHLYGYRDCRMNPFPFESSQSVLAGRKYRILGQFALVAKFQILQKQTTLKNPDIVNYYRKGAAQNSSEAQSIWWNYSLAISHL